MKHLVLTSVLMLALAGTAEAQSGAGTVGRDANQQHRIQQGLQSGALSTTEAARLQRGDARIDAAQSRALRDGAYSPAERARINAMQDVQSQRIHGQKHDAQTGNPNSLSSLRMQENVRRNANQERRIHNGLASGALTGREAARLERGQARTGRREAWAGADGRLGLREQARIQRGENRQSRQIYRQKHDRRGVR